MSRIVEHPSKKEPIVCRCDSADQAVRFLQEFVGELGDRAVTYGGFLSWWKKKMHGGGYRFGNVELRQATEIWQKVAGLDGAKGDGRAMNTEKLERVIAAAEGMIWQIEKDKMAKIEQLRARVVALTQELQQTHPAINYDSPNKGEGRLCCSRFPRQLGQKICMGASRKESSDFFCDYNDGIFAETVTEVSLDDLRSPQAPELRISSPDSEDEVDCLSSMESAIALSACYDALEVLGREDRGTVCNDYVFSRGVDDFRNAQEATVRPSDTLPVEKLPSLTTVSKVPRRPRRQSSVAAPTPRPYGYLAHRRMSAPVVSLSQLLLGQDDCTGDHHPRDDNVRKARSETRQVRHASKRASRISERVGEFPTPATTDSPWQMLYGLGAHCASTVAGHVEAVKPK